MRQMNIEEQTKVLKALARNRSGAEMMLFDSICYGGQLEEYRDAKEHIEQVIEAFPEDIRKDYDQSLRKSQADKLREQADRIENAKPSN